MNDREYEMHEAREYHRQLAEVEKAPLHERKQQCADFLENMKNDPALVGERIGWLLDGNYGYGSMKAAERVMAQSARANKKATLTHMIAALEWHCPGRMAIAAWKKLTPAQKAALDKAIQAEIEHHLANRG